MTSNLEFYISKHAQLVVKRLISKQIQHSLPCTTRRQLHRVRIVYFFRIVPGASSKVLILTFRLDT
jgi:hypothetical protein